MALPPRGPAPEGAARDPEVEDAVNQALYVAITRWGEDGMPGKQHRGLAFACPIEPAHGRVEELREAVLQSGTLVGPITRYRCGICRALFDVAENRARWVDYRG